MTVVGYARVSTDHQSLEAHQNVLRLAGAERVFTDKLSGVRDDRPGSASLINYVRAGDTVVVVALDRRGRSLSSVIRTIKQLTTAGVLLRSLREGIDYSTPTGRMLAGIFAALAEDERELMHERAAAARHAARLCGRHTGAPRLIIDQGPAGSRRTRPGRVDQRPGPHLRSLPRHACRGGSCQGVVGGWVGGHFVASVGARGACLLGEPRSGVVLVRIRVSWTTDADISSSVNSWARMARGWLWRCSS